MATISITVPDDIAADVDEAFAYVYKYEEMIPEISEETGKVVLVPNMSKEDFCRSQLIKICQEVTRAWLVNVASIAAKETAHVNYGNTYEDKMTNG